MRFALVRVHFEYIGHIEGDVYLIKADFLSQVVVVLVDKVF